jgi:ABC-type uncharacterized transport system ATPase subunit
MVIHDGKIMGIVQANQITKEDIGLMMLGRKTVEEEEVANG